VVFVGHFAGIALAQIINGVETAPALESAARRGVDTRSGFAGGTLSPPAGEAAQQEFLPAGLGRHVGKLLVFEVQLLGFQDGLHAYRKKYKTVFSQKL